MLIGYCSNTKLSLPGPMWGKQHLLLCVRWMEPWHQLGWSSHTLFSSNKHLPLRLKNNNNIKNKPREKRCPNSSLYLTWWLAGVQNFAISYLSWTSFLLSNIPIRMPNFTIISDGKGFLIVIRVWLLIAKSNNASQSEVYSWWNHSDHFA